MKRTPEPLEATYSNTGSNMWVIIELSIRGEELKMTCSSDDIHIHSMSSKE